jgi:hypothetical protein
MNAMIIDVPVEMHEAVTKARHRPKIILDVFRKNAAFNQDRKAISIVSWKAVVLGRYDVIGYVDAAFDSDDEVIFCVPDLIWVLQERFTRNLCERLEHSHVLTQIGYHLVQFGLIDHLLQTPIGSLFQPNGVHLTKNFLVIVVPRQNVTLQLDSLGIVSRVNPYTFFESPASQLQRSTSQVSEIDLESDFISHIGR